MYDYEVLEENSIPIAEAMEIMKKAPSKELTFEQKQALEHVKKMSKLKPKEAAELRKELEGLNIRKLKDISIVRIIDIVPATTEELKFIVADTKTSFDKEELEKIAEIVKKYAKG
jgi:DNA-directed RNA polymerase subunit F